MGFDQLSPIAPARVRCLLLPCGRIHLKRFRSFVERIEQHAIIRLADVASGASSNKGMFSPLGFPSGSVLYEFSCSDIEPSSRHLIPFELYRQPLVILGVADGQEGEEVKYEVQDFNSTHSDDTKQLETSDSREQHSSRFSSRLSALREVHSSALVHKILIFDSHDNVPLPDCVIRVPSFEKETKETLGTLMGDITSQFLEELSSYAKSVQALPNIETPPPHSLSIREGQSSRSELAQNLTQAGRRGSEGNSPPFAKTANGERSPYRASTPLHVSSPLASEFKPDQDRSLSALESARPPMTFDEINPDRPTSASAIEKVRSGNRVSVHGFGSGTTGERARNQARGRLGVVVGSMHLLTGRWVDAIKELVDSANIAKWSNDHPWFAKALDYILVSLLMCGWAGLDFEIPQVCYPGEKPPWNIVRPLKPNASDGGASTSPSSQKRMISLSALCQLLPDLVNHILHFYTRAATSSYSDQIPILSFSESVIRFARMLGIIRVSHCTLDDDCLQNIVKNTNPQKKPSEAPEHIESFSSTADIAWLVSRAMPVYDDEDALEVLDRLNLLAGIASVLALLGYHRKKAFVLRELVTCLLPALVQSRKDDAAELGMHPAASLSVSESVTGSVGGSGYSNFGHIGDLGIGTFLDILCEVYGVARASSSSSRGTPLSDQKSNGDGVEMAQIEAGQVISQATQRGFGNPVLKMDILRWCINICEALPDLPGMLQFSSYLLTTASSGMAPGPDSNDAYPTIPMEDQTRLIDTMTRASTAMNQLGVDGCEAAYWDEFLVRLVEVLSPSTSDLPIVRRKQELQLSAKSSTEQKSGPFLYNPFAIKKPTTPAEPTLLLNEKATFMVLVQNLFDVNLEIEWLKLDVTDEALEISGRNLTIGPYRTQKVYLTGAAKTLGRISIGGCTAKIRGCEPRRFSIFEAAWKPPNNGKLKMLGMSARMQPRERPTSVSSDPSDKPNPNAGRGPTPSTLTINVIKNQPTIEIESRTLLQSAVMVLLGQSKAISVTLINRSSDKIDFVVVSFTDSTSSFLQSAIDDKETPPSDIYEAEYSVYHEPAFKLAAAFREQDMVIPPKGELNLPIQVFGKPGLVHGAVQISYAHLGIPKNEVEDQFYTRQLVVPISVTVNASVELVRTDVLPFTRPATWTYKVGETQEAFSPATEGLDIENNARQAVQVKESSSHHGATVKEQYLLVLDFHNAWPRPLVVSLQANRFGENDKTSNDHISTTSATIQPGHSTRLMVPIPRVSLEHCHSPIPAINPANKRQFVLSSGMVSAEIETLGREIFWYREEILKEVQAFWQEQGSDRSGRINLRTMRLSPRMLEILKPEPVEIDVSIDAYGDLSDGNVERLDRSHFRSYVDIFVKVTVRVSNRSPHPIYPLLRLQPSLRHQPYNVALDLSRKLAFNGQLQRPLPPLRPRDEREVSLGIVFLSAGEYDIGACVEELKPWTSPNDVNGSRPRAGTGEFLLSDFDSKDRRIWYCQSPCLIDVLSSSS